MDTSTKWLISLNICQKSSMFHEMLMFTMKKPNNMEQWYYYGDVYDHSWYGEPNNKPSKIAPTSFFGK